MFGIRFMKVQPNTYLLQYAGGKVKREGTGLAFFYYAPASSLVAVPISSSDAPFIFKEVTADFQEITIQGQVTFRIAEPKRIAQLMNFTLDATGQKYLSEDPQKLPQRLLAVIQVLTRAEVQNLPLRQALQASDSLVKSVLTGLRASEAVTALGLEILGLSILAIKPTAETARALEADAREQLLRAADQAIYARRNAAVEQERAIKENELNTEIAVENKRRQIREAQMDAERSVQEKQQIMRRAELDAQVDLEAKRQDLVKLTAQNTREEADAKAYAAEAMLKPLAALDPKVLQALATTGMEPRQLIALAFRDLSENAAKIGELNVSPELLQSLLAKAK
ncbi:MAG TPA: SPFH domain-containing protein [Symbiobacteriaceae bacterium]|nr:SPFH domain-containing protein [Symbiobacteriaceae bacterium]